MLRTLDAWVGRTLFIPPIVRFCRATGWTQHRVSNMAWLAAALVLVAGYEDASFISGVFIIGFATLQVITTGINPDRRAHSMFWFRCLLLALIAFRAIRFAIAPEVIDGASTIRSLGFDLLVLIAEYAATIRTIPPLSSEKDAAAMKEVTAL